MELELITSFEQLQSLEHEWNMLLPSNATNEVFLTWQWQITWWKSYQPGDMWVLVAREGSGRLIGIAPWFVEQPKRIVRTIGCVAVTDYLDILARPEYRESFCTALADFLVTHADAYDRVILCNMPVETPTLEVIPRLLNERGFAAQVKQEEVCPVITLPADFEGYLANLDKKQRHEIRRKMRRAEGSDENVGWYIVGPQHDLSAEIDKFLHLMAASHPDKAQFLQDEQNVAFFRAIVPRMALCGWLQLSFLTVNGTPVATYLNFDFNNRILVYNSGLLPEGYSHLSPGIVLLTHNIQHAIDLGRSAFDFLRGNEEYKYRMGGQDRQVMLMEATYGAN